MSEKKGRERRPVDFNDLFRRTWKRMIMPFVAGWVCVVMFSVCSLRSDKEWETVLAGAVVLLWATVFGVLISGGLMAGQRLATRKVGGESGKTADPAAWKRAMNMMMAGTNAISMAISGGLGVLAGAILRWRNVKVASVVGSVLFWFALVLLGIAFVYAICFVVAYRAARARQDKGSMSGEEKGRSE